MNFALLRYLGLEQHYRDLSSFHCFRSDRAGSNALECLRQFSHHPESAPLIFRAWPISDDSNHPLQDVYVQERLVNRVVFPEAFQKPMPNSIQAQPRVRQARSEDEQITEKHTEIVVNSLLFGEGFKIHHPNRIMVDEDVLSNKVSVPRSRGDQLSIQRCCLKRHPLQNFWSKVRFKAFCLESREPSFDLGKK